MAQLKYKCNSCLKDFIVKYIFIKPGNVSCPYCKSESVQENKSSSCGCSSGSRFT